MRHLAMGCLTQYPILRPVPMVNVLEVHVKVAEELARAAVDTIVWIYCYLHLLGHDV